MRSGALLLSSSVWLPDKGGMSIYIDLFEGARHPLRDYCSDVMIARKVYQKSGPY